MINLNLGNLDTAVFMCTSEPINGHSQYTGTIVDTVYWHELYRCAMPLLGGPAWPHPRQLTSGEWASEETAKTPTYSVPKVTGGSD